MNVSEIVEAIANIVQVIADNPASILIVFGFISILLAAFVPLQLGLQILFGGLGFFMLIIGILVHVIWLQS
jgi:energy-coupling factor transporter transmembrane protein EcfT